VIYTIGYQALTPAKLAATVQALNARLFDCRSSPRSRIAGFGGNQLRELLGDEAYLYVGYSLGGRAPINAQAVKAIKRQHDGPDKRNAILMCLEDSPTDCHRHTAICGPHIPNALHILDGCLFTVAGIEAVMQGGAAPEPVGYVP
jgi:uncharacterized protein (DUF488 family)